MPSKQYVISSSPILVSDYKFANIWYHAGENN